MGIISRGAGGVDVVVVVVIVVTKCALAKPNNKHNQTKRKTRRASIQRQ